MDITFSPNILQPTSHVVQYHLLLIAASRSPSHLSQMGRSVSWRSTPGRPTAVFPAVIKTLGGTTTTGGQRRPSTREILISSSHPIVLIIVFELVRNNSLLIQLFLHRYFQTILNVFTSCFFEFAIYSSSGSACSILISNAKARHAGRYFPWRQIWSFFINSKSDKIEVLYASIYWKKRIFGPMTLIPTRHTHSQTTEYSATQLV